MILSDNMESIPRPPYAPRSWDQDGAMTSTDPVLRSVSTLYPPTADGGVATAIDVTAATRSSEPQRRRRRRGSRNGDGVPTAIWWITVKLFNAAGKRLGGFVHAIDEEKNMGRKEGRKEKKRTKRIKRMKRIKK